MGGPGFSERLIQRQLQQVNPASAIAAHLDVLRLNEFPTEEVRKRWTECLKRVDYPSHYTAPEFFLEPYWIKGRKPFAILAQRGSKVVGALTGLDNGKHVSCGIQSRPQICVDSGEHLDSVLKVLLEGLLGEAQNARTVSVFTWPWLQLELFKARGFRVQTLSGNVMLDLTKGAEILFKQFTKDRRRNIRFSEKNGVEVREATTTQDIADAYEVYQAWRRTERKKIQHEERTPEVFERAARLAANRRIFVARFRGKPIAMNIFRFYPGGLFESAANSSLDEFLYLKPNDLLQWTGIQWACANGMRLHSLGGSSEFLLRFGGMVVPTIRYRLDQTLLRRHDLRDSCSTLGHSIFEGIKYRFGHSPNVR